MSYMAMSRLPLTVRKFEKIFVTNLPSRTDKHDAMLLTATLSGLDLNWIDGLVGKTILEKVLPPPAAQKHFKPGNIGSWRAHLNAIATFVHQSRICLTWECTPS